MLAGVVYERRASEEGDGVFLMPTMQPCVVTGLRPNIAALGRGGFLPASAYLVFNSVLRLYFRAPSRQDRRGRRCLFAEMLCLKLETTVSNSTLPEFDILSSLRAW